MKKLKKYFIKLLCIILLFTILLPKNNFVGAEDLTSETAKTKETKKNYTPQEMVEYAGNAVADFAVNFHNDIIDQKVKAIYDVDGRDYTYRYGAHSDGYHYFDCVGFVSFVIHNSLGIGRQDMTVFGTPSVYGMSEYPTAANPAYQKVKDGTLMPGDIIVNDNHVMIYIGNNEVVHCITSGVTRDTINAYSDVAIEYAVRLTPEVASKLDPDNLLTIYDGGKNPLISGENGEGGFEFKGLPTGQYAGTVTALDWLFDLITQFMDYLMGLLFTGFRIQFVGWANIVEVMVNDFVKVASGIEETEETQDTQQSDSNQQSQANPEDGEAANREASENEEEEEDGEGENIFGYAQAVYGSAKEAANDRITVEDILYNRVPLLDINIFTGNIAGGQELKEDSPLLMLREIISTWFVAFRQIAMMLMLIMLIYTGIRIALSTNAERKSDYKKSLMAWAVAFVLIFAIIYFILIVLNVNEFVVSLCQRASEFLLGEETSIYDTIRTRAYELKISISGPATIMYMYLVYLMIRFLLIYIKRMFTSMILIIIAPLVAVKYSWDKQKGKGGTGLTQWMYDFAINAVLQSMHALLYTIFAIPAISIASESFASFVLACVFLNAILKSEDTFIKILNFGKSKLLKDTDKGFTKIEDLMQYAFIAKSAKNAVTGTVKAVKTIGRGAKELGSAVIDGLDEASDGQTRRTLDRMRNSALDVVEKVENKAYSLPIPNTIRDYYKVDENLRMRQMARRTDTTVGKSAKKVLAEKKKLKKEINRNRNAYLRNTLVGYGSIMMSLPFIIANPGYGVNMFLAGRGMVKSLKKPNTDPGYLKKKKHKKYRTNKSTGAKMRYAAGRGVARSMGAVADNLGLGAYSNLKTQMNAHNKLKEKVNVKLPQQMKLYAQAEELERELQKEYKRIKEENEKLSTGKNSRFEESFKEKSKKKLFNSIEDTKKRVSKSEINKAVSMFMGENDVLEVASGDINAILNKLKDRLDDKYQGEVSFASDIEARIKDEYKKQIDLKVKKLSEEAKGNTTIDKDKVKLDTKEMTETFQNAMNKNNGTVHGDSDDRYSRMTELMDGLHAINDESRDKFHKRFINTNAIINNLTNVE